MLSHCLRARLAYLVETNIFLDGMNVALAGTHTIISIVFMRSLLRFLNEFMRLCRHACNDHNRLC